MTYAATSTRRSDAHVTAAALPALASPMADPQALRIAEDAYVKLATHFRRQGRGQEALALLELAIERCAGSARVHLQHGAALEETGALIEALEAYEHALALDPDMADAHYCLGALYERMDDPMRSCRHFRAFERVLLARPTTRLN
ncbi:hypothetical protein CDN99_00950 [Roseateles aquatilis]|uniref:Uncharacterized protein n=1 Tax=Roseateles aquatilis TaxID=431061 RepID=A0A246JKT2_9BURK|nr:tetratricopeptide repeat protein [Roseateles aquatilis]OWQ93103.1 hypothetical protein CDN99_00950 [Roseateles aquatilis]